MQIISQEKTIFLALKSPKIGVIHRDHKNDPRFTVFSRMLYPDLSLITTTQNAGQNAQYATAAANAAGGQPGTVVSVSGAINPTPIVAPTYPAPYHTALTAGGHQVHT
jgi:hypothetical protein